MLDFKKFYSVSFKDRLYTESKTHFKIPKMVGLIENDGVNLREVKRVIYFKNPPLKSYPLYLGEPKADVCDSSYVFKLNEICHYMMQKTFKSGAIKSINAKAQLTQVEEVVTHRGLLVLLARLPYEHLLSFEDDWDIWATKFGNKLYLVAQDGKAYEQNKSLPKTYLHNFEQLCYAVHPQNAYSRSYSNLKTQSQLHGIYRSRLGNLNLFFSGKFNSVESDHVVKRIEDINKLHQVQLKLIKAPFQRKFFNDQGALLNLWARTHLVGVSDVYVGTRFRQCIETPLKRLLVNELPNRCQWSPQVCHQFMHAMINKFIDEMHGVNCPYTTYQFRFNSVSNIITLRKNVGKTKFSFLPQDYIDFVKEQL